VAFTAALAGMHATANTFDETRGVFVIADIRVAQGRLREAKLTYERGLHMAQDVAHGAVLQTDELYLGLSDLSWEQGDVAAAARLLHVVTESEGRTDYAGNRQRWCVCMARVAVARGEVDQALELLAEAESVEVRSPVPRLRPIPAMRARIWIAQGRMAEATTWANGLSVHDEVSYLREFEHTTLARLRIAQYVATKQEGPMQDALSLLERLLIAASRGGRKGSVIEILVLEALARHAVGNERAALDPLERALALGEPEGYVRAFVDHGEPLRDLLRRATARGVGGDYTRRVLRAFDEPTVPVPAPVATEAKPVGVVNHLTNSLTARELEILRLLAVGLRNQEIADQLAISAATVKRHIANAYVKLDASHRTEALLRAHALHLL
jgi:LuxR family transcriptional regulator, maltose regulon positive regulatory protein